MRRTATLILFALVAVALVLAQNPPGTNNSPATTPQTQNPTVPNNGTARRLRIHRPPMCHREMQDKRRILRRTPPAANTAVVDEVGAGTEIHAALDTPLSSKTSKPGDRFTATVSDPVRANNGAVVIPAGARVEGEVAESEDEKTLAALKDKPKLSLRFRDVVLPTGQTCRWRQRWFPCTIPAAKIPGNPLSEGGKGSNAIGAACAGNLAGRSRDWPLARFPAEATL